MRRSRVERKARERRRINHPSLRSVGVLLGTLALVALAVIVVAWWESSRALPTVESPAPRAATVRTVSRAVPDTTPANAEVPDLSGLTLAEAKVLVQAAGLRLATREEGAPPSSGRERRVHRQTPEAGSVARLGSLVTVTVPPSKKGPAAPSSEKRSGGFVVVIDPGHQSRSDLESEPIGPGSKETKPRITGGSTGVITGLPEYEVALQISTAVKRDLERAGFTVVMTRSTNDVRLSNADRARMANKADADLLIRIHAGASPDPKRAGVATCCPGLNRWTTKDRARASERAAMLIRQAVVRRTGAVDRGSRSYTDVAGFNFARSPAIIIETGMLSNPVEDRLLSSPAYQDKLAAGIVDGVVGFFDGRR